MKRINCLVASFFTCYSLLFSQSNFNSFDKFEESRLSFFAKYLTVKPSSDAAYGGLTFNFKWHLRNTELWKPRFMWEETLLSDWAGGFFGKLISKRPITDPWSKSGLDHAFSSGFFGSFQYGINVIAREKLILSPCISFGDNLVAVQRYEDVHSLPPEEQQQLGEFQVPGKVYRDPAGYFFFAGPSLVVSYIPMSNFWMDAFFTYEFTAYDVGEKNIKNFIHIDDYPTPNFISIGLNLNHKTGWFIGSRFYTLVNRGSTNTSIYRFDFNLGFNL